MSAFSAAKDSHDRRTEPGRRRIRKGLIIAVLAVLGVGWTGLATSSRKPYTCAVCRLDRVEHRCFGRSWSTQQETDCSRWYAEHVEPVHVHSWAQGTHCRFFGIRGIYGGYACSIGGPITMLSRLRQIAIYQHFQDPLDAKRLFIRMGQRGPSMALTLDSLLEWGGEGYPGTWDEWQANHSATSP